jgi:hypothetical protein
MTTVKKGANGGADGQAAPVVSRLSSAFMAVRGKLTEFRRKSTDDELREVLRTAMQDEVQISSQAIWLARSLVCSRGCSLTLTHPTSMQANNPTTQPPTYHTRHRRRRRRRRRQVLEPKDAVGRMGRKKDVDGLRQAVGRCKALVTKLKEALDNATAASWNTKARKFNAVRQTIEALDTQRDRAATFLRQVETAAAAAATSAAAAAAGTASAPAAAAAASQAQDPEQPKQAAGAPTKEVSDWSLLRRKQQEQKTSHVKDILAKAAKLHHANLLIPWYHGTIWYPVMMQRFWLPKLALLQKHIINRQRTLSTTRHMVHKKH